MEVYTQNIKVGYATSSELVKDNGAELKPVYVKYVRKNPKRDQDEEFDVAEEDKPQNVSAENGILSFSSTIPDNGMRKVMKFRIQNIQGYSDEITVIQLPYTLVEQYYVNKVMEPIRSGDDESTRISYMIRPLLLNTPSMKVKLRDNGIEKEVVIPFYYRTPKRRQETLYKASAGIGHYIAPDALSPLSITVFDEANESNVSPAFYVQSQYGETGKDKHHPDYGQFDKEKRYRGDFFNRVGTPKKGKFTYWFYPPPVGDEEGNRRANYLRDEDMKLSMRAIGAYRAHNNAMLLCDLYNETLVGNVLLGRADDEKDYENKTPEEIHQLIKKHWRMPTVAELLFIIKLQQKNKNINILESGRYWAANGKIVELKDNGDYLIDYSHEEYQGGIQIEPTWQARIRCVRDVIENLKDEEDEPHQPPHSQSRSSRR